MFENPFKGVAESSTPAHRKQWTSRGLYYTLLAGKDSEFTNFYSDYIHPGEIQALRDSILAMTDKKQILAHLSNYLRVLNIRRNK